MSSRPPARHGSLGTSRALRDPRVEFADKPDLTTDICTNGIPVFVGTYSYIFRGSCRRHEVAIKVIRVVTKLLSSMRRKVRREQEVWGDLDHPNIVPLYGYTEPNQLFGEFGALISPWYKHGDAGRFLQAHGPSLTMEQRYILWQGVINGVTYLHTHIPVIIHGDLKPGNILIDDEGNPRICDFGLCSIFLEDGHSGMTTTTEHAGTERYLAPELVTSSDAKPTTASDVYALGCIGLDFLFLQNPYSNLKSNRNGIITLEIMKGTPPALRPSDLSQKMAILWDILEACWQWTPTMRIPASTLLARCESLIMSAGHSSSHQPSQSRRMTKNADVEVAGLADGDDNHQEESGQLRIHSVPKKVADALNDQEKKRQEAINEVINTERDFVRDMEYLRDVWVAGIRNSAVIHIERRDAFISNVFWNILAIIDVNTRLRDLLSKRQKQSTVVGEIGDIFKKIAPTFGSFVDYSAHQVSGIYKFEKEKGKNPAFAAFAEEIEKLPESRDLKLNDYLIKPTTRLAQYPLLLEAVLKYTPESSPDKFNLQRVIQTVREFLSKVNQGTGEAKKRIHLDQLERQLAFRQNEYVDLRLSAKNRKLIYKGSLNSIESTRDDEVLQVFLFDHALLIVKQKAKVDQYEVYCRPIPLELLIVSAAETSVSTPTLPPKTTGRIAAFVKPSSQHEHHTTGNARDSELSQSTKNGFPITFTHLGWRGYTITLSAGTLISKKNWIEHIQKQQEMIQEKSRVFELVPFSEGVFIGRIKVNCAVPFNDGVRTAYGTDDGVYFSDSREPNRPPVKMLALPDVTQVDILHESQELIVLAAGIVSTFPLEVLDQIDPRAGLKRRKEIATHTSFFKTGFCNGSFVVCILQTTALNTTVKIFKLIDQSVHGNSKPTFKKSLQRDNDTLKLIKEGSLPTEVYSLTILQTCLYLGSARDFQILDLETLDTHRYLRRLINSADPSLSFIEKKQNLRPLAVLKVNTDFLLCYSELAVFVDERGKRARGDWRVNWKGRPTAFAFNYPYVIAIEPSFVEIWDVITCTIKQVIPGKGLHCLFVESPPKNSRYSPKPHISGASSSASPGSGQREIVIASEDIVMFLKQVSGFELLRTRSLTMR